SFSDCFLTIIRLFFFKEQATTMIYTLSLHDALPISLQSQRGEGESNRARGTGRERVRRRRALGGNVAARCAGVDPLERTDVRDRDRKSTRLNSSHRTISYAVFCLKKKNTNRTT